MKRIGMIGMILGALLVIDGIYMVASHYNNNETQAWNLPDGWIIIISAAVLVVASVLAFVLSSRKSATSPGSRGAQTVTQPQMEPEKR